MAIDDSPVPTLYAVDDAAASNNGVAIGIGVAVGAVLVAGGMFYLFRKIRAAKK
jgi:hypothetical protein